MEKILKILNARFCKLTKNSATEKRVHRYSQKSLRRGNKAEGDKYQRLFVKKSLQYLPHHLFVMLPDLSQYVMCMQYLAGVSNVLCIRFHCVGAE